MPIRKNRVTSLPPFLVVAAIAFAGALRAETPPEPDVLVLNDGEKLIGQLLSANGPSVKFKSNALGDVTVDWSKIKELHTPRRFAVIPKNVDLRKPADASRVPQGTLSMADQKLSVNGATTATIPVADSAHVVEQPAFQNAVEHQPGLLAGWKGAVTGGAALVESTQNSRTFTAALNLVRAVPEYDWLAPRDRTTINLSAAYGDATQPGSPSLKTSIYHADGERDEYFNARWFGFGLISYDHNFGQGLNLAQNYGGGIGWTVLKEANQELDLKGSFGYIRQDLSGVPANNLAGATAGETFNRKFKRGVVFNEQISVTGALNNASAYSGVASAMLAMPVYKRLNFTVSTAENYLGDPPPGFRRSSFQFVTGVTYALK
ncbi:MAG: DUF481 domain-containing protein [Bryobacteraceae bacterium]|jgi:hypothetical protein